jgi:hypothetical protein
LTVSTTAAAALGLGGNLTRSDLNKYLKAELPKQNIYSDRFSTKEIFKQQLKASV